MFGLPTLRYHYNGILGLGIRTLSDVTRDPQNYGTNDDGVVELYTIGGKDKGVRVILNAQLYVGNGDSILYTNLNDTTYTVTIRDILNSKEWIITILIGYDGSGSSITYNGTTYTQGQKFLFF